MFTDFKRYFQGKDIKIERKHIVALIRNKKVKHKRSPILKPGEVEKPVDNAFVVENWDSVTKEGDEILYCLSILTTNPNFSVTSELKDKKAILDMEEAITGGKEEVIVL